MPQTRFVLRKALGMEKKVIVVVNKIDRPAARCPGRPWPHYVDLPAMLLGVRTE